MKPYEVPNEINRPLITFDFGPAIAYLKAGRKVARKNWGDEYLFVVKGDTVKLAINTEHGDATKDGYDVCDAIYKFTAQNEYVPWVANQSELLTNDWQLIL